MPKLPDKAINANQILSDLIAEAMITQDPIEKHQLYKTILPYIMPTAYQRARLAQQDAKAKQPKKLKSANIIESKQQSIYEPYTISRYQKDKKDQN